MNKKKKWVKTILGVAKPCKGKFILSILFAIFSVIGGFIPYLCVFHILCLFLEGTPTVNAVLLWTGLSALAYFFKVLCYGISTTLSHVSAYSILEQLRLKIIDKMMKAPLGDVLNQTSGSLKNTIVDRVETIELPLAHMIPEGISNMLLPLGIFIYLLTIDWRMAIATLITMPIGLFIFSFSFKDFNNRYDEYMKASNHVNSVIIEYVGGIEVIKAFSQGKASYEKFSSAVIAFKDLTLDWFQSTWKNMNFVGALIPSVLLTTLPLGMWLYSNGSLTATEFAICLILALGIIPPLLWLSTGINNLKSIQYAVNDASELLELNELLNSDKRVDLKNYNINLSSVTFSYDGKGKVLNQISMNVPQGSYCALVGPSGGGKSTVARLIARFWDIEGGSISIGGVDIRQIPLDQLSSFVSFVTQDNILFNCSLLENIRLGNINATNEEVYAAAKLAQCDEFIRNLPNGYHTTAGEAGGRLSGGERQRIAIARAMLKNTPIVILDEATAFTDPENEDKIQASISALTKGKTLLVIAHRLSTIKDADKIVVLQNGHIVASGNQQELLKECSLYRNMWETHIGAKKWVAGKEQVNV